MSAQPQDSGAIPQGDGEAISQEQGTPNTPTEEQPTAEQQPEPTVDELKEQLATLQRELEKVRQDLSRASAESAQRRRQLQELQQQQRQAQDAQLPEIDRLKKQLAEAEQQNAALSAEVQRERLRQTFEATVAQQNLTFVSDQARRDAFLILQGNLPTGDEAGTQVAEQVRQLQKDRSYLFARPAPKNINASASGQGGGPEIDEEEIKRAFGLH